jgi:RNA polymerase sigma-70 factor (ECF subfamily)
MHAVAAPLPPFWSLVEAHGGALLGYARRLAGDDGEDVLQDAFLRALRAYPTIRHGENLRGWLFQITTRAAYDHHGRRRRRAEVLTGDAPEPAASANADGAPGAGDDFETLIAPLSPDARAALALRYVDDLPYDDIAERLGCSPAAARQRVSTAIRTLRRSLS